MELQDSIGAVSRNGERSGWGSCGYRTLAQARRDELVAVARDLKADTATQRIGFYEGGIGRVLPGPIGVLCIERGGPRRAARPHGHCDAGFGRPLAVRTSFRTPVQLKSLDRSLTHPGCCVCSSLLRASVALTGNDSS